MNTIREKAIKDENAYEITLKNIADRICRSRDIKLVLITGGSCAGKTTTTRKLSELITAGGRKAYTVSLDDYYRNYEESVYLPDGTRDIESINSLRLDIVRENMSSLLAGKETAVPMFDFTVKRRIDGYRKITLEENDVVIIEGLHALSPALFETAPDEGAIYRVFLYADAGDGADCRFVRRLVRDSRYRGADAVHSYDLWDNVKKNEAFSIDPYRKFADVAINTFFPYERNILDDDAVNLLKTVPEDNAHYSSARELIDILGTAEQWPDEVIPENSLLREFI